MSGYQHALLSAAVAVLTVIIATSLGRWILNLLGAS